MANPNKSKRMRRWETRFITAILVPILLIALFSLYFPAKGRTGEGNDSLYPKLQIFSRILYYVMEFYVEEVDLSTLLKGAIQGMLKTLDPYSVHLSKEVYRQMKEETTGKYYGVGIEIEQKGDHVKVLATIPDSPAEEAGILPGDRIVKVDGKEIKGLPLDQAILLIKGPRGTKVTLSIMREGLEDLRDFILVRDQIRVRSVRILFLIPGGVGFIKLAQFQEFTANEVKNAVEDLIDKAEGRLKGLIFDLRDNPGGLLDEAVKCANLFLKSGIIVSVIGRDMIKKEERKARGRGTFEEFPIVIIMNRHSASAAEIFAAALQDHGRAKVVGERSFGKGSVQTIYEFEDGSALKLTIARYLTPSGKIIDKRGIFPDVEVSGEKGAEGAGMEGGPGADLSPRHLYRIPEVEPDEETVHELILGDPFLKKGIEVIERGETQPR